MKYTIYIVIAVLLVGCGSPDPAAPLNAGDTNPPPITDHYAPQGGIHPIHD